MTVRPLVLVGAGGFARETVEVVAAINARHEQWNLLGFIDDDPGKHGTTIAGLPVLGGIDVVVGAADIAVAVCVGSPRNVAGRRHVVDRLGLETDRYATLIHPMAVIPASVSVGHGTVIHAMTVATGWATIGAHVEMMPGSVITHDDTIEDFATIAAGVRLAGNVTVERCAYIGSGALVREELTIGASSLVGMGSVVTRNIPPGEVWVGSPARFLRSSAPATDLVTQQHDRSHR